MKGLTGKGSRLTGTILRFFIFSGILSSLFACRQSAQTKVPSGEDYGKIIYDTYIMNRDSTDSWGEEALSGFNRQAFINRIFDDVFNGKITPYDYFTGEKIALKKIRDMESSGEFSRKNISKIQFEERWLWDTSKMKKQVISMTIAYEVYDISGRSRGQKPVFKLVFQE
jgi:hypothetical protein